MGFIVKNTTFGELSELFCPNSCLGCGVLGKALCECCKKDLFVERENYCLQCKKVKSGAGRCPFCGLEPCFMVGWKDGMIGDLARELKYNSNREVGEILGEILDAILPEIGGEVCVVPLPTIQKHIRKRGLDHTRLVARKLASRRGWRVETGLERAKNTVQVGQNELVRRLQADEAYFFNGKVSPHATYILLDDVWTTGASMRAASKKLREAGASKIILTVLAVSRFRQK